MAMLFYSFSGRKIAAVPIQLSVMKKPLLLLLLLAQFNAWAIPSPYICFTDLLSGPSSGNSDNSQPAQVAGQDGAIVTLWGKNLGAVQGSSQVLVGGIAARVYRWTNANAPAQLYSTLGLQMVEFQLPGSLPTGNTTIQVVVNGVSSNPLPFTVRNGNIYFIKITGNDVTGDGSWLNPWASLDNLDNNGALNKINPGDIIYLCDNTTHTIQAGDRACIDLGNPGTTGLPKAIIGYPGALASIGNPGINNAYSLWVSGFGPTINWVIAKLQLTAKDGAANMYHNFRVVGNKITAPNGSEPTGAIAGQGNQLYVLGNELTNIGYAGTSKLYHPIYIQSAESCSGPRLPTETDREIAWNYLHDNYSYDGINIYRECGSSAYMTDHRVHDNFIENQTGCGIRIGDYVTGENWFYNNIIVNAGIGPNPTGDQAMHVPVLIHAGWEGTTTLIHFYNNTIYGGGFTGGAAWSSSMVGFINNHPVSLDFRNNIIVSTVPGVGYLNPSLNSPSSGSENNLWSGAGPAPAWDANAIAANPIFVNTAAGNFRLQNTSPAINVARPLIATPAQPLPPLDFDGQNRQSTVADLGAFEFAADVALPVNWVDVQVKRLTQTEALVQWQVSSEQNVKEYAVQVSSDNQSFTNGCFVAATAQPTYNCTVATGNYSTHYLRVQQRDNDGSSHYSKTVVLKENKKTGAFLLAPNPANGYTQLIYNLAPGKRISVAVFNSNGVLLQKHLFSSAAAGVITLPMQQLPPGLYRLHIQYDSSRQTLKLIKQ
jgi:uncharacterized protein (TIGR03437 family)